MEQHLVTHEGSADYARAVCTELDEGLTAAEEAADYARAACTELYEQREGLRRANVELRQHLRTIKARLIGQIDRALCS